MTGFNVFQIKISWKYEFLERRNVSHFSSGVSNGDIYKVMAFQFRMYHAKNVLHKITR